MSTCTRKCAIVQCYNYITSNIPAAIKAYEAKLDISHKGTFIMEGHTIVIFDISLLDINTAVEFRELLFKTDRVAMHCMSITRVIIDPATYGEYCLSDAVLQFKELLGKN